MQNCENNIINNKQTKGTDENDFCGPNAVFTTFDDMKNYVANHFIERGLMFGIKNKCFTKEEFIKAFGMELPYTKLSSRGFFYCIPSKKQGAEPLYTVENESCHHKLSFCVWRAQFGFNYTEKVFFFKQKQVIRTHNHLIDLHLVRASDRRLISYEGEMSTEEAIYAKQFGPANLGISKVREIMMLKYPDRNYDGKLLGRLLKSGHQSHFGSDPDCISKFMKKGQQTAKAGGVFDFEMGADMRLNSVFVMLPQMKAYGKRFGDFLQHDGTHCANIYGLIVLFVTLVDSLGKSVIHSYSCSRSESEHHIKKSIKFFHLDKSGSTYMTDGGSCFELVCQYFNFNHLLCVHHFQADIFSCRSGLGVLADDFIRDMNSAIFGNFFSTTALQDHLDQALSKYGHVMGARKFIAGITEKKEMVCYTHTSRFFTAGASTTQRGEGSNQRIKQGRKKDIRHYNLLQFFDHYAGIVERQEEESLQMILSLIQSTRMWSEWVNSQWVKQSQETYKYSCSFNEVNGLYSVFDSSKIYFYHATFLKVWFYFFRHHQLYILFNYQALQSKSRRITQHVLVDISHLDICRVVIYVLSRCT